MPVASDGGEDLSQIGDERLAELFRQRCNDSAFLDALNEELKDRTSDAACELHLEVVQRRRIVGRPTAPSPAAPPRRIDLPGDWLRALLMRHRLGQPDGRPLFRYRMTDTEYDGVTRALEALAATGRLVQPDSHAGAVFVAYCAEWFRRESNSTFLRWDDPAPTIFAAVPYADKQELTLLGLRYWDRTLRRGRHGREFLLTVALEGGFPVRILEGAPAVG